MATASSHTGEGLSLRFSHHRHNGQLSFFPAYLRTLVDAARADTRKNESCTKESFTAQNTRCISHLRIYEPRGAALPLMPTPDKSSFADKDLKKLKQIEEQLTKPERKSKAKFWRKTLHSSLNFRKGRSGGSWLPVPEVPVCPRGFLMLSKRSTSVFVF